MAVGRRSRKSDVFFNVPYDTEYEPLYLALIAGLTGLGLVPRCVLEIPSNKARLDRILDLIKECGSSLHDLSRVKPSGGIPRFNMPFEAGLAVAWAQLSGKHRWFALEEKSFRIQKSLSDLNGFDPLIHGGTAAGVLRALVNAFGRPNYPVTAAHLQAILTPLQKVANDMKRKKVDRYSRAAFLELVLASQVIRENLVKKGALPPPPP
jgi:hypothetical protein